VHINDAIREYFKAKDQVAFIIATRRPAAQLVAPSDVMVACEDQIRAYFELPARPEVNVMVTAKDIDDTNKALSKSC
jgi:hypothetical protein